jgi:hypothetical protein
MWLLIKSIRTMVVEVCCCCSALPAAAQQCPSVRPRPCCTMHACHAHTHVSLSEFTPAMHSATAADMSGALTDANHLAMMEEDRQWREMRQEEVQAGPASRCWLSGAIGWGDLETSKFETFFKKFFHSEKVRTKSDDSEHCTKSFDPKFQVPSSEQGSKVKREWHSVWGGDNRCMRFSPHDPLANAGLTKFTKNFKFNESSMSFT